MSLERGNPAKKLTWKEQWCWAEGLMDTLYRAMLMQPAHVLSVQNTARKLALQVFFPCKFCSTGDRKRSICINGISLTAFQVGKDAFSVAIIPYTYEHTNIKEVFTGSIVNLEFDMLGKYIARKQEGM